MKLKSITIERFKRLERVTFELGDVNILIGGNNSGKSTIIQAVHFAFTLFQSLSISDKWPARTKKSSTVSPSELIYIPSDDPYSLGYGGRLLEDAEKSIVLSFVFDDGETISVAVRKGRITNILVEPDNIELAKGLSSLGAPFTVFSPGLAGVSRTENYVSDGVLLRALARGDANIVLRNILYRLNQKAEWTAFEQDLSQIFPLFRIEVKYDASVDQFIGVTIVDGANNIPLDLAGTGLLQAIQILAYLHLFSPKIIILDEPDSHLHPNNQRLLCSLLSTIAIERNVQVLITTHSRHVLDTMYNDAKLLWVQDGSVSEAAPEDQIEMLLELGALDIKEKIKSGNFRVIVLTEDRITNYLKIILRNSGFIDSETTILPYNGVTSVHLLQPLVKQIKELSDASIFVHRDRDYLEPDEAEGWKKQIRAIGAEPFITEEIDIEDYFCSDEYILHVTPTLDYARINEIKMTIQEDEKDEILASYINGRVDIERKAGTIGKLDYGKLSAASAKKVGVGALKYMKGKRKLAKLRHILQQEHGLRFDIDGNAAIPLDTNLAGIAEKYFRKKS